VIDFLQQWVPETVHTKSSCAS